VVRGQTSEGARADGAKLAPASEGWEFDAPDVTNMHRYARSKDGTSTFELIARRYV
jgi:hypothetical protein